MVFGVVVVVVLEAVMVAIRNFVIVCSVIRTCIFLRNDLNFMAAHQNEEKQP